MTFDAVERIADAVLFEGYILYPYRPSSIKNQQRWNFGTLFPRAFAESQKPPESYQFQAEMLVEGKEETSLDFRARFLQLVSAKSDGDNRWDQGFVRSQASEHVTVATMQAGVEQVFDLTTLSEEEAARASATFQERLLVGKLTLRAKLVREGVYRLTALFANDTPVPVDASRKAAQASAFTSAHLLMQVTNGAFVSLLEPTPGLEKDAAECINQSVFPVLAGEAGDRSRMLCSPIILYDYPQIAPESPGDFFDGTEMDEMLALRVMTLSDEEKAEMRRCDPHARAILERTETLPMEQMLKIHGAVRGLRSVRADDAPQANSEIDGRIEPWNPFAERPALESVRVFGIEVRKGDRVRLWPRKKADIIDIATEGKIAVVEKIEQDLEDQIQFAVVLEDDPGKDMGMLRQAGHRFFYSPEEIEPLDVEARSWNGF
jgi:hypothetical protein